MGITMEPSTLKKQGSKQKNEKIDLGDTASGDERMSAIEKSER